MNIQAIDALLPQTQCTRCGFPDCLAYAKAISTGTPHNQCPPGGTRVIAELSQLLNRPILTLNPSNGVEAQKMLAFIREEECIGCTKCIQACPVDAIIGAAKQMHTVITDECTGCMLCVEPCPVDCIDLTETKPDALDKADHYRQRHYARLERLEGLELVSKTKHQALKKASAPTVDNSAEAKKAYIAEALLRAKAKRNPHE
ncbi:MAG: RnfABCDGE type electron transport complex subunit B [Gammaproteobacteria bacterium]|nr:RnfABCDGE type electron transport complex subunit B [Gammaproteobacteria bacterium]